jgi:hypothetical protein
MKSKLLLFASLVGLVMVSSCKKDKTETPFAKIQSVTNYDYEGGLQSNVTYVYDDQGRISNESNSDGSYSTYQYASTSVTKTSYSRYVAMTEKVIYTLNSAGQAISSVDSIYSTGSSTITKTAQKYFYTYDGAGFLVKTTYSPSDGTSTNVVTTTNTITASNIATVVYGYSYTSTTSASNNVSFSDTTVYQFLSDKANTIGPVNFGKNFLGSQNANLPVSGVETSVYNSEVTISQKTSQSYKYTYEYNDNGFVSKVTTVYTYNLGTSVYNSSRVSTYTYK